MGIKTSVCGDGSSREWSPDGSKDHPVRGRARPHGAINETSRDWDICRAVDLYRAPRNKGDERTLSDFLADVGLIITTVTNGHQQTAGA